MSSISTSIVALDAGTDKSMSKVMADHLSKVKVTYDKATPADKARAKELSTSGRAPSVEELTPTVAAVIVTDHNEVNRDLTVSKVLSYLDAMDRGDWRSHHQGIAFYPDGTLADGQHRMNALALAMNPALFLVYNDFDKGAIDGIDRTKSRTAGEALEMMKIQDGKLKAATAKQFLQYDYEMVNGRTKTFDDPQIERYVIGNDATLSVAISVGRASVKNVSEPAMTEANATKLAYLLLSGGMDRGKVQSFIAGVQQGIATYTDAPTLELSRRLTKAQLAEKKKDRITTKEFLALALKAASLWEQGLTTSKLVWKADKESLPDYHITAEKKAA